MSRNEILEEYVNNKVIYGHREEKWNPRILQYLMLLKDGTCVIDYKLIVEKINKESEILKKIVASGKKVLFVCTKEIAKSYIENVANSVNMPYVTEKWFGGILTNFSVVRRMVKKIDNLSLIVESPGFKFLSKKEQMILKRNINKKEIELNGIAKKMYRMPGALLIIDVGKEKKAVKEANELGIPIFGLMDTNSDPTKISNGIPCNDDSLASIKFVVDKLKEAIEDGLKEYEKNKENFGDDMKNKNNISINDDTQTKNINSKNYKSIDEKNEEK